MKFHRRFRKFQSDSGTSQGVSRDSRGILVRLRGFMVIPGGFKGFQEVHKGFQKVKPRILLGRGAQSRFWRSQEVSRG